MAGATVTALDAAPTLRIVAGTNSTAGRRVLATVAGDTSYPTGGYALTAANFGLTFLETVVVSSPDVTGTWLASWVSSTGKLKLFSALGTEVTSTTDVHTAVFTVEAVGT